MIANTEAQGRLNDLGYTFLGKKNLPSALALFSLNTEFHPGSSDAWDSLGEAATAAGDPARAAASYRKLLEVLPADATLSPRLRDLLRARATAALAAAPAQ